MPTWLKNCVLEKHAIMSFIVTGSDTLPSPLIQTCLRHCCAFILSSATVAAVFRKNYLASTLMLAGNFHWGFLSFSKKVLRVSAFSHKGCLPIVNSMYWMIPQLQRSTDCVLKQFTKFYVIWCMCYSLVLPIECNFWCHVNECPAVIRECANLFVLEW